MVTSGDRWRSMATGGEAVGNRWRWVAMGGDGWRWMAMDGDWWRSMGTCCSQAQSSHSPPSTPTQFPWPTCGISCTSACPTNEYDRPVVWLLFVSSYTAAMIFNQRLFDVDQGNTVGRPIWQWLPVVERRLRLPHTPSTLSGNAADGPKVVRAVSLDVHAHPHDADASHDNTV